MSIIGFTFLDDVVVAAHIRWLDYEEHPSANDILAREITDARDRLNQPVLRLYFCYACAWVCA